MSTTAWDRLRLEEQIHLLVGHVEWILHQAILLDINIDPRSISAVVAARRAIEHASGKREVESAMRSAEGAFTRFGFYDGLDDSGDITECAVAYLCLTVTASAMRMFEKKPINDSISLTAATYLREIRYMWQNSPFALWIKNHCAKDWEEIKDLVETGLD